VTEVLNVEGELMLWAVDSGYHVPEILVDGRGLDDLLLENIEGAAKGYGAINLGRVRITIEKLEDD
jgi:hypothetical protein